MSFQSFQNFSDFFKMFFWHTVEVRGCELSEDTCDEEASLKADSTLFHFPLQRFDIYVKPTHFHTDLCHLLDRSNSQIEIYQSK